MEQCCVDVKFFITMLFVLRRSFLHLHKFFLNFCTPTCDFSLGRAFSAAPLLFLKHPLKTTNPHFLVIQVLQVYRVYQNKVNLL